SADQIMIVNGSQQGIDLLAKLLLDQGDSVLVENPTYIAAIQSFSLCGPVLHTVAMDEHGIDPVRLQKAIEETNPRLVYCMPNFQNPSGLSYSDARRAHVAEIVRNTTAVLLEDDPYGELRFRGDMPRPIAHYLPERTVLLGSFSKTISPG